MSADSPRPNTRECDAALDGQGARGDRPTTVKSDSPRIRGIPRAGYTHPTPAFTVVKSKGRNTYTHLRSRPSLLAASFQSLTIRITIYIFGIS